MTVIRQDTRIDYEITDADPNRREFPFEFPAKEVSQIHVFDVTLATRPGQADDEVEIERSRYSVQPAVSGLDGGGTVTLSFNMTVGHILRIVRVTPQQQNTVFRNQKLIYPPTVEQALDLIVMMIQENRDSGDGFERLEAQLSTLHEMLAAEAAARVAGDNNLSALLSQLDAKKADRSYVDNLSALLSQLDARKADRSYVDARLALMVTQTAFMEYVQQARGEFTAYRLEIEQRLQAERAAINAALAQKQPIAPEGGPYGGSSGGWVGFALEKGYPFERTEDNRVVRIVRLGGYLPNPIWTVGDDEIARLRQDSRQGDRDNLFINIDGTRVVLQANA